MRFFTNASVLTILVLSSIMPATSIFQPKVNGASTQFFLKNSARLSIGNDHERFIRASIGQAGSLDKRSKGEDLILMCFQPRGLLMPIHVAAEVLEAFYTDIAVKSIGDWSKITPRIWIRMTFRSIRLLMTATEGTTIPWNFVAHVAVEMLRLTELGYTGMYDACFVSPTMGNAIWVSLYYSAIGPLTDPATASAPAKVASCLNANAPAWFPQRGTPSR